MINRVVMVGRMTRDPELRRTGSGAAVTSFTLALNRNYKLRGCGFYDVETTASYC